MDEHAQLVLIRLLVVIAAVGAIIFWCIGALRGRQSHLIFAAAILLAIWIIPLLMPNSADYSLQSGIVLIVFGLVSTFLGMLFKPPRPIWRVLLLAAGIAAITGGIVMIKLL